MIRLNLPENSESTQQRDILDALPVLVFLERAGDIVYANAEARRALGACDGDWVSRPVEQVLWGLFPGVAEPQTALLGTRHGSPFHATLACKGGRMAPVEGTYSLLNNQMREGIIVAHMSLRERATKPKLMEDVLASIPEAVAIVVGNRVLYTNPAFTEVFGYSADEVGGHNLRDLIVPETRQHENGMLQKIVDERGKAIIETVRVHKQGDLIDVAMHVAPLLVSGEKAGYVLTFRDIGERKQVEEHLQQDAIHDILTGLPNRALFLDHLELALSRRMRRPEQNCGVLLLDIDGFKEFNDGLGHAAGDLLLTAAAERVRGALRPQDTAARVGPDEFGILVENVTSANDLETIAGRLLHEMERPIQLLGHAIQIRVSVGAALAGPEHDTPEALVQEADVAMMRARHAGGHRYELFDRMAQIQIPNHMQRERLLRGVLEKRQFELGYEPIFRLATGRLDSFETSLRWRRPDGSVEGLQDLMPFADESGILLRIGHDTLDRVCRQLRAWGEGAGSSRLRLSLNVTARQLFHDEFVGTVRSILQTSGVDPSRLILEISESQLDLNADRAVAVMQRVADFGVRVALDDFGAGMTALNHVLRLPLEWVKVHPALTVGATENDRQIALLEAVIHVAKSVGVQLVAQGIQTEAQLAVVQELGCELGQGTLLSVPMDAAQAQQMASGAAVDPALQT